MSYARSAVTRMTLDMSRLDLQRSETVTLGDTNRRWEVTLINGGAPFRLPPNWTAALTGIKPDGNGLQNGCSVVDGKIIYDFAAGKEIATCVGSYPVHFDIWDEVGELVASPKLYVNVLADVRPHAELKSDGQYTQIGNLIGKVNQIDADVDRLAEKMLTQGDDITALKEKVTTAGTVTIPASEWTDTTPHEAFLNLNSDVFAKGCIVLFAPEDDATKEAAGKARMSMSVDKVVDAESPFRDFVMIARAESGIVPTIPLNLRYTVIKTDTENKVLVALIGVDAYGEVGGTASGVDETAVKKIINSLLGNVANVRQYSADNPPPYPVTSVNGKTGAVSLSIPSKASDVGADPAGTAESMTNALREEVNTILGDYAKSTAIVDKIYWHNVSTVSHEDLRLELQRLADRLNAALNSDDTSLDDLKEIVAYIKSNKTLIDGITSSKVNVTDIVNNLTTNTANVPLSAAQGVALKLLIDSLEEIVESKVTAEQVVAQIKTALTPYILKGDADKTYQPAGDYLTPTTGDQRYPAKQTTEDALSEHAEKIAQLEEALENATIEPAESVEWLNANGDTAKKYYLPDGYIYAYMPKTVTVEHNANDGTMLINNRPTANADMSKSTAHNGPCCTLPIAIDNTWSSCVVNISGLDQLVEVFYAPFYAYFYDSNGAYLGYSWNKDLGVDGATLTLPVSLDLAKSTYWSQAGYVRLFFGIKTSSITASDIAGLVANIEPLNTTKEVEGWYSTGIQHSNDKATQQNTADIADLKARTTTLEEGLDDLRETVENGGLTNEPTGEVLIAIGDSITYGTGVGGNANAWPAYLIGIMGYDAEKSQNLGISGIGYCTTASGKTVRTVVDETDFSVADVVTVAIGINDWKNQSATMGNFFSEMEYCLGKIRGDNPYCRIVYILPFNCKLGSFDTFYALGYKALSDSSYCFGNTLQTFVNRMKSKFEEETIKALNIHVLDMTKTPAITRYNLDTTLIGGDDGIHPTAETHRILAREIARRISNT